MKYGLQFFYNQNYFKESNSRNSRSNRDLIGNKIANKITNVSKKTQNNESRVDSSSPKDVPKKRYKSPEERQQIIDELRLVQ